MKLSFVVDFPSIAIEFTVLPMTFVSVTVFTDPSANTFRDIGYYFILMILNYLSYEVSTSVIGQIHYLISLVEWK